MYVTDLQYKKGAFLLVVVQVELAEVSMLVCAAGLMNGQLHSLLCRLTRQPPPNSKQDYQQ